MPHLKLQHFPPSLNGDKQQELVESLCDVISTIMGCNRDAISIAFEAVDPNEWQEKVYIPEIKAHWELLSKKPNY